ncbi:MAG: TIGR04283 family arsenosugar biosynthesis glycosyltransferase [Bacteroidia bacterium]|nr:TIGR04283 family arsenosugar biosynthesis glycosyltransferase [Bacteroidia bacterium]
MKISIIIPVYNEEKMIAQTIRFFKINGGNAVADLIVIDGGSKDDTVNIAKNAGAVVYISPVKGRAPQMNLGALKASGDILYFVHADSTPPITFASDIFTAVYQGYLCGCYRLKFLSDKRLFLINEWFTRFNYMWCRGGDQTLYTTRKLFNQLNGFNEYYVIMEEYDFIIRSHRLSKFKILKKSTLVSARKYEYNNWLKVMIANYTAYKMFMSHVEPKKIRDYYTSKLK